MKISNSQSPNYKTNLVENTSKKNTDSKNSTNFDKEITKDENVSLDVKNNSNTDEYSVIIGRYIHKRTESGLYYTKLNDNFINSVSNKTTEFNEPQLDEPQDTKPDQYYEDLKKEKMSNKNLMEGVTYNPYTDKYTLILNDYGVKKREFTDLIVLDGSTKIVSEKPITKEYLEERYKKIQHYFETEFYELNKRVSNDNSILKEMGIGMHGFSQRDSWGIVKIDGEYVEIDVDEFKKHYDIYSQSEKALHDRMENNNDITDEKLEDNIPDYIKEDHALSVYYKELNGIKPSFENAEELEYYVKKEEWKDTHINTLYRKVSLAVNLGLLEEGDQTLFPQLYQTNKASYTFKNIKNDILSQAILDSIEKYSGVMEGIMYDVLFGTEEKFFQNELNKFAQELQNNPSKYPSVNSDFVFTGDVNLDENSTQEYKDFITNTLIDYIEKQKNDYISGNHPIKDPYRTDWSVANSFDVIVDNLKNSLTEV